MPGQGERWTNQTAFILAAVGSAIGLGNIWRFPHVCYDYGGGAFLIAYVVALITAGIPLLIIEIWLGHRMSSAGPRAFRALNGRFEWAGWLGILMGLAIMCFYAVIMAWCLNYAYYSIDISWGEHPQQFFEETFLKKSSGPFDLGGVNYHILLALLAGWVLTVAFIWRGARTISRVVYFTVVAAWWLLMLFVVRAITLPGAFDGLRFYLTPDLARLFSPDIWFAAYGQVFFSLSIGIGVMIAYASFLPPKADIVGSAIIIAVADTATSILGGFAVFGVLGYYSDLSAIPLESIATHGPGLTFVTYPQIINHFPFAERVFGFLFFLMLFVLAVNSVFSIVEAAAAALRERWNLSLTKSHLAVAITGLFLGLPLVTGAGYYWVETVNFFITNFGIALVCLIEVLVLCLAYGGNKMRTELNLVSETRAPRWFNFLLEMVAPGILLALLALFLRDRLIESFQGGERAIETIGAEFVGGWAIIAVVALLSLIIPRARRWPAP